MDERCRPSPPLAIIRIVTLEPIFDPRKRRPAPSPAKVDLRVIFIIGTIIFAILTIGFAIVRYGLGMHPGYKFWVCLFGFLIGLIMLVWERFNRSTYMRLANDDETITDLDAQKTEHTGRTDHTDPAITTHSSGHGNQTA